MMENNYIITVSLQISLNFGILIMIFYFQFTVFVWQLPLPGIDLFMISPSFHPWFVYLIWDDGMVIEIYIMELQTVTR